MNVIPKNNGDLMHVCSAETSPFIVAFTALFELEQVSKICKPINSDIKNKLIIHNIILLTDF